MFTLSDMFDLECRYIIVNNYADCFEKKNLHIDHQQICTEGVSRVWSVDR